MNCKITYLLIYMVSIISPFAVEADGIRLYKIREAGDALDLSIRQELNRSTSIGVQWLKANRNSDNSWGDSNKLSTTAICTLALASVDSESLPPQAAAGRDWIIKKSSANTPTNFYDIIWSTTALLVTGSGIGATGITAELSFDKLCQPDAEFNAIESALRREIIIGLNLKKPDASFNRESENHYQALTEKIIPDEQQMLRMWLDARVINRIGSGNLINAQGESVAWRRILAKKIISSQSIDPKGGGFWRGQNRQQTIQNTATAILISKEL